MNRYTPTAMRRRLWRSASQFIEYPRVVEVRHSSWNDPATLAAFTRKDVGFCQHRTACLQLSLLPYAHNLFGSMAEAGRRMKNSFILSRPMEQVYYGSLYLKGKNKGSQ